MALNRLASQVDWLHRMKLHKSTGFTGWSCH